jgi:hypothetical protein
VLSWGDVRSLDRAAPGFDQIGAMTEFRRGDLLDRAFLIGIVLRAWMACSRWQMACSSSW